MKKVLLFLFALNSMFVSSQSLRISVSENHFRVDETNLLIVSHIENIAMLNDFSGFSELILSLNEKDYYFNLVPNDLEYTKSYLVTNKSNQYILYFTQLPIISIDASSVIVDDPKIVADFVYSHEEEIITSKIGIEIRGGSSKSYPKKTYDLEFWEDNNGEKTHKVQFGNMRFDDDWILDALYNEPLRLRSYVANNIWLDIHKPYYLEEELEAKSGANVAYAELFLDGRYNGLYNISEQVDKKQLKLKSYKEGIRGELYKGISWGASTFSRSPNYNNDLNTWSGYEVKYPKGEDIIEWENLYSFTDFVLNSSDVDFTDNIWNEFNYDNYLDYFIFLNLLRATDNTGKNIYLAKYNSEEPYFYIPWDLDGCFGTIWNGENENITDDILTNGLFNRVIELGVDDYPSDIAKRWFEYREDVLNENNLIKRFEKEYQFLLDNKLYERENLVYPNYSFGQHDYSYLLDWLQNRLVFLDVYFDKMLPGLSYSDEVVQVEYLSIYPNPTKDKLHINNIEKLVNPYFQIFDFSGRLLDHGNIVGDYISVLKLDKGIYILVLDNKKHMFIVQ
jgi:hypothetical protein